MRPISPDTNSAPQTDAATRLRQLRNRIDSVARHCGRNPDTITLIAVSKTHPVQAVRDMADAGARDFGENYLQEALAKISQAPEGITWHYIGRIQRNKTRDISAAFDWVHTVDRLSVAERLGSQRPATRPPLNICVQVNVDNDPNKGGVAPESLGDLLEGIRAIEGLRLRGLMTILDPATEPARGYGRLQTLFHDHAAGLSGDWDTLSMGMTGDFEAAIAAGATHIRIGTALFGARQSRQNSSP